MLKIYKVHRTNRHKVHNGLRISKQVLLSTKNINFTQYMKKLDDKQIRSLRNLYNKWDSNVYKLDFMPQCRNLFPVFYVSLLVRTM